MSTWGDYILKLLERGYVTDAALHDVKDGKRWATSPEFQVLPEEAVEIVNGFQDGGERLRQNGLYIAHTKYSVTHSDSRVIVGQEDSTGTGCVLFKCQTCVIIATHSKTIAAAQCQSVVERVGEFLRNKGY
ncbi:profilin-like [Gigantopelta aegis]|uniref:profilin-like n=1 Tax=Gigantopelta aegis TaxID=1735272 RepID=UPI001B88DA1E|nr:profilin-like [Gigantopelta aegis]